MVIASTQPHKAEDADPLLRNELVRRGAGSAASPVQDPLIADLTQAADQFIVRRGGDLHTVIAGYHWFSDWGRDTMIALPGLTLVTGRFDIARDILLAFSRAADRACSPTASPMPERLPNTTPSTRRSGTLRRFESTSNTRPIATSSGNTSTAR